MEEVKKDIASETMSKRRAMILSVGFLLLIIWPVLDQVTGLTPAAKSTENKALAPWPEFNPNRLDEYPPAFERWFTDNFKTRGQLLQLYSSMRSDLLRVQAFPDKVLEGKEGWYYWVPDVLNDYRGVEVFSEEELTGIDQELKARQQWCSERSIHYAVVVIPNKMSIYPEHLPENAVQLTGETRLDQLMQIANKQQDYQVIDLRKAMLEAKSKGRLYHKTDTHWNELGAYYGYAEIIRQLQAKLNNSTAYPLSQYHVDSSEVAGMELARTLGIEEVVSEQAIETHTRSEYVKMGAKRGYQAPADFPYPEEYEEVYLSTESKILDAFIVRDSYSNALVDFLPRHFNRTVLLWDNWEYNLNEQFIEQEKPDVVLTILIERHLQKLAPPESKK